MDGRVGGWMNLLQLASSDRSIQSAPPSHFQLPWMHSPLPQWNSRTEQRWVATTAGFITPQFWGHSSEPSAQSTSPSQAQRRGTQAELLHWKDVPLQVTGGQETSSLPSSQSASSSHTKEVDTHWPFLQLNSFFVHCLGAKGERTRQGVGSGKHQEGCKIVRYTCRPPTHHNSPHQLHSHNQFLHHTAMSLVHMCWGDPYSWTVTVGMFWSLEAKYTINSRYVYFSCCTEVLKEPHVCIHSNKILTATTRKFICAISTVVCAITDPSNCDAFPIATLEQLGSTCCQCIYDRKT